MPLWLVFFLIFFVIKGKYERIEAHERVNFPS
jgi:hypothetical protein